MSSPGRRGKRGVRRAVSEIALSVRGVSATFNGMKFSLWSVLAVTLLFPLTRAYAQTPAAETLMQRPTAPAAAHFVGPVGVDFATILPAPPSLGSLAAAADLETVLQTQAWRTPEQVAWAKLTEKDEVFNNASVLGSWFAKEHLPATVAFFKDLGDDVYAFGEAAKNLHPRIRPYLADSRVQPCAERPTSNSYPSRHTMFAFVWAGVLADLFPEKRAELLERAHRAAWGRIIGGVHFPSDVVAGRLMAEAFLGHLKQSAAYRAALEKVRTEVTPFLTKKAA